MRVERLRAMLENVGHSPLGRRTRSPNTRSPTAGETAQSTCTDECARSPLWDGGLATCGFKHPVAGLGECAVAVQRELASGSCAHALGTSTSDRHDAVQKLVVARTAASRDRAWSISIFEEFGVR